MLNGSEQELQQPSLPTFMSISPSDVEQAANIIQRIYLPQTDSATSQALQRDLVELQLRPEAWGLVVPFLNSTDPQIQFFGAHTAQLKIARDWEQWPITNAHALRDLLLNLTTQAAARGVSRVVMRKLYVALSALALRLCPLDKPLWQDWIKDVLSGLVQAPIECAPDFLCIAVEEVRSADLLGTAKTRMTSSLKLALPLVMQLFLSNLPVRDDVPINGRLAWLKAAEAWVNWGLPGDELTSLVPILIDLLRNQDSFVATCDVLGDILSRSSLSEGKGTKALTEPLLQWISAGGSLILQESLATSSVDEISHAFCKLLVAIGEHSTEYLVRNVVDPNVQTFLRTMLGYTGFPGWYGADEEESEMTLQFWSSFQDVILDSDFSRDATNSAWPTIKAIDLELVTTLIQKARWPTLQEGYRTWGQDQRDKFQAFRRDLGDTLINTYYVVRDELFLPVVPGLVQLLAPVVPGTVPQGGWEAIESALYSVKALQEAIPSSRNPYLETIFGPDVLGRLPMQGQDQIRRTALDLIGAYSTWFHELESTDILMNAMNYVVTAFSEPSLSLHTARALRDVCENNRKALSTHIDSFATLYANLPSIPDTEKAKVLQAICSVIQGLPLKEGIGPVEGVVTPLVNSLAETLSQAAEFPEEARIACVARLQALSGCARGLTNNTDPLSNDIISIEDEQETIQLMEEARQDPRMVALRADIIEILTLTIRIWSADAEISEAVSELIKAITSLPADNTLLSLPPAPILELVCNAAQRQITQAWLSLATMLTSQLGPAVFRTSILKGVQDVVGKATLLLVQYTLAALSPEGAMDANPDIVRGFFVYLMTVSTHFIVCLIQLPTELMNSLMECAIRGLTLEERYSLVEAAKFLHTFCRRTFAIPEYLPQAKEILKQHGPAMSRALMLGIAGASPRSTIPNLVELLALLLGKIPEHRTWMKEVLYSPEMNNPLLTREAKDKFLYVATSSRSTRQTCDAANEFSLIARGLAGSSFGYASNPVLPR